MHDCEHFEHVLSLLNLPCNLLDVKYTINVVDLIFDNCYIIDGQMTGRCCYLKKLITFVVVIHH